jgi:hypothetical protein
MTEALRNRSPAFRQHLEQRQLATHRSDRKPIRHPEVGNITVDCDVLVIEGSDVRVVLHTTEPATPDSDKLRLVTVIGLQDVAADVPLLPDEEMTAFQRISPLADCGNAFGATPTPIRCSSSTPTC